MATDESAAQPLVASPREDCNADAARELGVQRPARRAAALAATAASAVALGAFGVWLFSGPQAGIRSRAAAQEPRLLESPPTASVQGVPSGGGAGGWTGWHNAQSKLDGIYQAMPWVTSTTTTTTTSTVTTSTTTTSTTTWFMEAEVGEACYKEVVETMHAVQDDPKAFDGVNEWSSFEEVQDFLYHRSFGAAGNLSGGPNATACWQSSPCQTARVGSECYDEIIWAANENLAEDPDSYPNLTEYSSIEDFQMHLYNHGFNGTKKSACPKPCAFSWRNDPSLFCWSVARQFAYEADIMRSQLSNGAGIFACDGFAVLSEENWTLGRGPGERIGEVSTVTFQGAWVGRSRDGTAGNAELFINAWDSLMKKTFVLRYDWVIKADPDAVIIADRLRDHVRPHTGQTAYVRNCNALPGNADFPMMYGSLEAISKEGLRIYRDNLWRCRNDFTAWWQSWGEDLWMGKCLLQLGVGPRDDFGIVSDGVCLGDSSCGNWWSAAFHPYKNSDAWMNCWWQATFKGVPKPGLPEL